MTARQAGVTVAIAHMLLVGAVGMKLLMDRATLPRGWVRTAPYDPSLPIRGRYVRLRLEVPLARVPDSSAADLDHGIRVTVEGDRVSGVIDDSLAVLRGSVVRRDGSTVGVLREPVAYFIAEHVPDPSVRPPGEELWAEVTLPKSGPPRPIRLGVFKDGALVPLPTR